FLSSSVGARPSDLVRLSVCTFYRCQHGHGLFPAKTQRVHSQSSLYDTQETTSSLCDGSQQNANCSRFQIRAVPAIGLLNRALHTQSSAANKSAYEAESNRTARGGLHCTNDKSIQDKLIAMNGQSEKCFH